MGTDFRTTHDNILMGRPGHQHLQHYDQISHSVTLSDTELTSRLSNLLMPSDNCLSHLSIPTEFQHCLPNRKPTATDSATEPSPVFEQSMHECRKQE